MIKERLRVLCMGFALLLAPFSIVGVNASIPGFESFFVFRIILLVMVILTPLIILLDKNQALDFLSSLIGKRYLVLPFVLLAYSAATIFTAVDRSEAVRYTVLLATGVGHFYLLLFYLSSKKGVSRFYNAVIITVTLALAMAVIEMVFGFRMPVSNLIGLPERYQLALTSFFHNQNDFSAYLVLMLPFLFWPLITDDISPVGGRGLIFGLSLLSVFSISFNSTMINLVALFAFAVAMLIYLFLKGPFIQRKRLYAYAVIFSIFLLLPFPTLGPDLKSFASKQVGGSGYAELLAHLKRQSTVDLGGAGVSARGLSLGRLSKTESGLGSLPTRLRLMENTFEIVSSRGVRGYVAGVGAGNIEHYMAEYDNVGYLTNVHNWWLEIFANFGLFGAAVVGLFVLSLIKDTWLSAKYSQAAFAKISLASLLVLLLVAVSPSSLKALQFQWIVFAFAAANIIAATKLSPK